MTLFALKELACKGEASTATARRVGGGCDGGGAAADEVGTISHEALHGRVGPVPRLQPAALPCATALLASRLRRAFGHGARAYCIVSGADDPIVNGVYARLSTRCGGAPEFAQLGRGVPVYLRRERVERGRYRWVIEQPHARIFESAAVRAGDEGGGEGGAPSPSPSPPPTSAEAVARGISAAPARLIKALSAMGEDTAEVGDGIELPPPRGWTAVGGGAAGDISVLGQDLVVRARCA